MPNSHHPSRQALLLALPLFLPLYATAQTDPTADTHTLPEHTYQLSHTGDPSYAGEIVTLMRNMLDKTSSVRLDTDGQELVVTANTEQTALAEKLLDDVDSVRPPQSEQKASELFPTPKKLPARQNSDSSPQFERTYYIPAVTDPATLMKALRAAIPPTMRLYFVDTAHAIVAEGSVTDLERLEDALHILHPQWSVSADGAASDTFTLPAESADSIVDLQTLYLPDSDIKNRDNEVLVALRNLVDPRTKVFLVQTQHAIVLLAPEPTLKLAQKIVSDLDVKTDPAGTAQ